MKEIAAWALETAKLRGATLAEARIVDERNRYRTGTPALTQQDSRMIRSVCRTIRRGRELALPAIRSSSN